MKEGRKCEATEKGGMKEKDGEMERKEREARRHREREREETGRVRKAKEHGQENKETCFCGFPSSCGLRCREVSVQLPAAAEITSGAHSCV